MVAALPRAARAGVVAGALRVVVEVAGVRGDLGRADVASGRAAAVPALWGGGAGARVEARRLRAEVAARALGRIASNLGLAARMVLEIAGIRGHLVGADRAAGRAAAEPRVRGRRRTVAARGAAAPAPD